MVAGFASGGEGESQGNHHIDSSVTRETSRGAASHHPSDENNRQLGPRVKTQEGASGEQGVGEGGLGRIQGGRRTREKPPSRVA